MDKQEFSEHVLSYIAELWPDFKLNSTQADLWWHNLRHIDRFTARDAIGHAYASHRFKEPKLADLRDGVRELQRVKAKKLGGAYDLSPEYVAQVQREEAETQAELAAAFTPEDLIAAKEELFKREPYFEDVERKSSPYTRHLTKKSVGRFLMHFISERFIHARVNLFPHHGKYVDVAASQPTQVHRDTFWDMLAPGQKQKKKKG